MIRVEGLHKAFGKLQVLDNLDLKIDQGGIFVILGPNGSGKTTLIKSVLGMVVPDAGSITIDDTSILKEWEYRGNIDYLPQIANFPSNLSVSEIIKLVKELHEKPTREQELISLFGLEPFLDKKLGHLSGGTKQKVNIVLTFMFNSDLVILDEPTSGLDPIALLHLKELIKAEKEKGKTILITTHIMSFVEEMADEIVFLLDGKIYFKGTVQELQQKTEQQDLEHAIANILEKSHA
ncbi:MAG: ABC transporter ATP-binding protein [Flavobacteriales bacterium]